MKKYIIIVLVFLSSFLLVCKVNAATESLYTYDKTSLDFVDSNYTVTRSTNNIFTLTNSTETVILDYSDLTNVPFIYSGYQITGIQNIMIYGTNNKIEILIVPLSIKNLSTGVTSSNFQYTVNNVPVKNNFILDLSNPSYTSRRSLKFTNNITVSGYPSSLNNWWRFSYSTTSKTYTMVGGGYPSNGNLGIVDGDKATIPIYYSDFNIQSCNSTTCVLFYKSNYNPLPEYLNGYKKVTLDTNTKYAYLSKLNKGKIYIKKEDFKKYGGKLSYWDIEKDEMKYDSVILDYKETGDKLYVYQEFNLSNYEGSDLVLFNKFLYLENLDYQNFEYDIYVPETMYVSKTKPIPNELGGNDFPAEYENANGEIIPFTPKSEDKQATDIEKTIFQIRYNISNNNLLEYFTNTWNDLKESRIYNYVLLGVLGGIIIFLFKVMNR